MNSIQGFSLTEVLVSLLLVSTASLGLITQQWHVGQLFNQAYLRVIEQTSIDNSVERELS